MSNHAAMLLVVAVLVVGVLHTLVPDHWAPIALIARQRGWSTAQTARAAALAGVGHVTSTLLIAAVLWFAGVAFATRFGKEIDLITSAALVAFGGWVAVGALREIRHEGRHDGELPPPGGEAEASRGHAHVHRHEGGLTHSHWHVHGSADWHDADGNLALAPPLHQHEHSTSGRTALLLVLGSSPMVEGIPAFFAASRFGPSLIIVMAIVFAAATIGTYVTLCVASAKGLQRMHFGSLERYGEVISGSFIAVLGIAFLFVR